MAVLAAINAGVGAVARRIARWKALNSRLVNHLVLTHHVLLIGSD
jgi:hypothetical protein